MFLAVRVPDTNQRGSDYAEQLLTAWHQQNRNREPLALEWIRSHERNLLCCRVPDAMCESFERQLYAQYPDATIEKIDDPYPTTTKTRTHACRLRLFPDIFPMRRYTQFEDPLNRVANDPIKSIFQALHSVRKQPLSCRVTLTLIPAPTSRVRRLQRCLRRISPAFLYGRPLLASLYMRTCFSRWPWHYVSLLFPFMNGNRREIEQQAMATSSGRIHDREDDLQSAGDKLGRLLYHTTLTISVSAPTHSASIAAMKLEEIAGTFGTFAGRQARFRRTRRRRCFLLSTEEVATLWHPPTETVQSPFLKPVTSRDRPAPLELPTHHENSAVALLGVTKFRNTWKKFGLLPEDRFRHVALLGKTGMGKSTLLQRLVISDIHAGRGVGLIDPHGDLFQAVAASVPKHRTNDVVLFDPSDRQHPIAFNILDCPDSMQRPLVASGVLSAFKKLYADSWGPRMEHILRNALLLLLECPQTTLVSLVRLLSSSRYRRRLIDQTDNPIVRHFWLEEFAGLPARLQAEAVAPIQNKIGHFISSPILRNIVGQSKGKINLRRILDEGKILLVNLSKGQLGDDASQLLGSFLVTDLQLAALSRADSPEEVRRDFFLYVDEFQNYATESFATILSEARKYRLALTVANQYLGQLDEATLHALFGNIGTLISFQVGANDAELLAKQLGHAIAEEDLMAMPRYHAYARLLIDGEPSPPFSMRTLRTGVPYHGVKRSEVLRNSSRHRYARSVSQVEQEIAQTLSTY